MNLAVNARDAMPNGGRLTVKTANVGLRCGAGRNTSAWPRPVRMPAVTDTGTGIDT